MFAYWVAVVLARALLDFWWFTSRIQLIGKDRLQAALGKHGAVVVAFWHQHLLLGARFMVSRKACGLKAGFMISPSVDGQAPTMLAQVYGAHVVRGSGSYTGLRAVRGAHQAIDKEGISLAITPDGPRGPRFVFKAGAIFAAQMSGRPVIPLAYAARPARLLRSWDKFVLPPPFARVCIAIGEPFYPPPEATGEQMAAMQEEMKRRLHETYQEAARAIGLK